MSKMHQTGTCGECPLRRCEGGQGARVVIRTIDARRSVQPVIGEPSPPAGRAGARDRFRIGRDARDLQIHQGILDRVGEPARVARLADDRRVA